MRNTTPSTSGPGQGLWPILAPNKTLRARYLVRKPCARQNTPSQGEPWREVVAPFRRGQQRAAYSVGATASEIIASVLNEEYKPTNPASLLQLLDRQGWGVRTDVTRRFSTQFAGVTLESSWDDDPSGTGRVESRRLALLAVFQEWLVCRGHMLGRLVDAVERLRPGYLPGELVARVRAARSSSTSHLTPDTEALDSPALLRLAALVLPPQQLEEQLDRTLAETRRQVLASPAYRGRDDLLPSLDRGLAVLRASALRVAASNRFRAAHVPEVLALEAELRKQRRAKRERSQEPESSGGLMSMWFRDQNSGGLSPSSSSSALAESLADPNGEALAKSAVDRLYGGQLVQTQLPWMSQADRQAAVAEAAAEAAATAAAGGRAATAAVPGVGGRSGPRGLMAGRVGVAAFRELPGTVLYTDPGRSGWSSFAGADREAFNQLDAAIGELMAKGSYEVPAAVLTIFGRLHRTALVDALSEWQWQQAEKADTGAGTQAGGPAAAAAASRSTGAGGASSAAGSIAAAGGSSGGGGRGGGPKLLTGLYPAQCSHAVALRPPGPLLVGRRTKLVVGGGGELAALRALVRSRGFQTLEVVHPLARKQMAGHGEWEYWYRAFRLWDRFAPMPPTCRAASLRLVLTLEQVSYVGLPEAEAAGRAAAAAAAKASSSPTVPLEDVDMSSLSSMDFDEVPLTAGAREAATASGSSGKSGGSGSAAVETESRVDVSIPPAELRRFMLALLELLPSHVGDGPAAAFAPPTRGGSGAATTAAAAVAAASSSTSSVGEWLPADATSLQIRFSPPAAQSSTGVAAAGGGGVSGGGTAAATAAGRIPEELEASCYEVRWAQGAATLLTAPSGPSAAAAYSRLPATPKAVAGAAPSGAAAAAAVQWSAPMRVTQAQLLSLINVFTVLAQHVPEQYGIQPPRLVVPARSPLEGIMSAARAAAASIVRAVGLLALLAVPLAAVIKGGGGDLGAVMSGSPAAAAAPGGRFAGNLATAARAREAPSATLDGAASPSASARRAPPAMLSVAELAEVCRGLEAGLEGRMWLEVTGTAAATTVTTAPAAVASSTSGRGRRQQPNSQSSQGGGVTASHVAREWPEFQVVVERRRRQGGDGGGGESVVRVLGCRPVNAAGREVYGELPVAAALRGRSAEAAVASYLSGLTPTRIERGKATPGRFDLQYRKAMYHALPVASAAAESPPLGSNSARVEAQGEGTATSTTEVAAAAAATADSEPLQGATAASEPPVALSPTPPSAAEATETAAIVADAEAQSGEKEDAGAQEDAEAGAATGAAQRSASPGPVVAAEAAAVAVLKLELRPSAHPTRHVVQARGDKKREFAQVDVVVRPWYDSDSLLSWMRCGVQLPSLGAEIQGGLLEAEDTHRAAFLAAYERQLTGTTALYDSMPYGSGGVSAGGSGADGSGDRVVEGSREAHQANQGAQQDQLMSPGPGEGEGEGEGVKARSSGVAGVAAGGELPEEGGEKAARGGGGSAGGQPQVLQPQQLSEQQLQEALQQLFSSLGLPAGRVQLSASSATGGAAGSSTAGGSSGPSSAGASSTGSGGQQQ